MKDGSEFARLVIFAQQSSSAKAAEAAGPNYRLLVLLLGIVVAAVGAYWWETGRRRAGRAAGGLLALAGVVTSTIAAWRLSAGQLMASAMVLLLSGMYLVMTQRQRGRIAGMAMVAASLVMFSSQVTGTWRAQLAHASGVTFWVVAAVLLVAALGTVSSRSAIHSAIWFALTLLCTGALMLAQGAQFIGIATVAVYAGAIVVTFLFVLMLSQPEGRAFYDRVGWGRLPTLLAAGAAALIVGMVVMATGQIMTTGQATASGADVPASASTMDEHGVDPAMLSEIDSLLATIQSPATQADGAEDSSASAASSTQWVRRSVRWWPGRDGAALQVTLGRRAPGTLTAAERTEWSGRLRDGLERFSPPTGLSGDGNGNWRIVLSDNDVWARDHVAVLGRNLYGRHLVAVEMASVLLFLALVGAVAMSALQPAHITGYAGRGGYG